MSDPALAALGPEKAFSICAAFIKSGGDDGKGTGVSNSLGQGQEERKVLYKWYKQATEGDITGTRPGLISSTMKVMKYDAWASVKGASKGDAMRSYIAEIVKQCARFERDDVLLRFISGQP